MADPEVQQYLHDHRVAELFQSLTVGLVYHRPDNAVQFLLDSVERLQDVGADHVMWDTFLSPGNRLTPGAASLRGVLPPIDPQPEGEDDQPTTRTDTWATKRTRDKGSKQKRKNKQGDKNTVRSHFAGGSKTGKPGDETPGKGQRSGDNGGEGGRGLPELLRRPEVKSVLQGGLLDLPLTPTNTVRIFLSSTFSDFKAERNVLPRKAYPKIQQFCSEKGLDFQVVDMRWGVTDDVINDHQVSDLCIREIAKCQQVSCGPNFVAFVGNRYGYRPYPSRVGAEEFRVLLGEAERAQHPATATLTDWFLLDTNAVPPEYILQPIDSKLEFYDDLSAAHAAEHAAAVAQWEELSASMLDALRHAATSAHTAGTLSRQEAEKYFISVTEQEIQRGILVPGDPKLKSCCFKRQLIDIQSLKGDHRVGKFIDMKDQTGVDEEAEKLRDELVEEKIPSKLGSDGVHSLAVEWTGVPLEESTDRGHLEYLDEFSQQFVENMVTLINANLSVHREDPSNVTAQELYMEVLHHAKFANIKCEIFCGRTDSLESIQSYLLSAHESRPPMFVHAASGYGKTAVMAKAAQLIPTWIEGTHHVALRFLGTSSASSNILSVLKSLINQICAVYAWMVPSDERLDKLGDLRRYFWALLDRVHEQYPDIPLILLLDAVDQLSLSNGAHSLYWLPKTLHSNIYIIVSTLSDRYDCLQNAKLRFKDGDFYHGLPLLSTGNCDEIVTSYLEKTHRNLTSSQRDLILDATKQCAQPLFLKLILDDAREWHSYDPPSTLSVATSVNEAISNLFSHLEASYGHVFVSHTLGYLTCGRVGLTDLEMEDALSCDDDVLSEVYKYHDPPLEGTVRIPSLMWARIQDDIKEYLTERQVDGKSVVAWYHRQFWEATEHRYLQDDAITRRYHTVLAELYSQESGIQRSVVLHQRKGKVWENADRAVNPQPLSTRNQRKLNSLPFHLLQAGDKHALKTKCLFHFKFLHTKLAAIGVGELHNEISNIVDSSLFKDDKDAPLICDSIELSYDALRLDSTLLAYNIKDRLGSIPGTSAYIQQLVAGAEEWLKETDTPLLLPTHNMKFLGLGSPLKFSLISGSYGILSEDETSVLAKWQDTERHKILCLKLHTKDIVTTVSIPAPSPLLLYPNAEVFFYIEKEKLVIREFETGDLVNDIVHTFEEYDSLTPRCLSRSSSGRYIAVGVKTGKPKGIEEDAYWKITSYLVLIEFEQEPDGNIIHFDKAKLVGSIRVQSRKYIERAEFVDDDKKIIALGRERIYVYSVPKLETLSCLKDCGVIYGLEVVVVPQMKSIVTACCEKRGGRLLLYNYDDYTNTKGPLMHGSFEERCYAYGVKVKGDQSTIALGISTEGREVRKSSLCLWDHTNTRDFTCIATAEHDWKLPEVLEIDAEWKLAYIGWKNGNLSIVDIQGKVEMFSLRAHGSAILFMQLFEGQQKLVTMSADHALKVWEIAKLQDQAQQAMCKRASRKELKVAIEQTSTPDGEEHVDDEGAVTGMETEASGLVMDVEELMDTANVQTDSLTSEASEPIEWGYMLDPTVQCMSVIAAADHVITSSQMNNAGPKLWRITDGCMDRSLTEKHEALYRSFYYQLEFSKGNNSRMHGALEIVDDYFVFIRRRRDCQYIYITQSLPDPVVIANEFIEDAFFTLIPPVAVPLSARSKPDENLILIRRNASLEIRNLALEVKQTIEMPDLAEIVGNLNSNAGKKKLVMMKNGVTMDGKYYVFINPSGKPKRYMDIVDLEEGKYSRRLNTNTWWRYNAMEESFFVIAKHKEAPDVDVFLPSKICDIQKDFEYLEIMYQDSGMLSHDHTLGLEVTMDYGLRVWSVKPLKKISNIKGHTAEISGARISHNNQWVVSGSHDQTVRVWSVSRGQQVAMFHVYGTVSDVMFTPCSSYVVIQCYSAPQRKRAAVLKLVNVVSEDIDTLVLDS